MNTTLTPFLLLLPFCHASGDEGNNGRYNHHLHESDNNNNIQDYTVDTQRGNYPQYNGHELVPDLNRYGITPRYSVGGHEPHQSWVELSPRPRRSRQGGSRRRDALNSLTEQMSRVDIGEEDGLASRPRLARLRTGSSSSPGTTTTSSDDMGLLFSDQSSRRSRLSGSDRDGVSIREPQTARVQGSSSSRRRAGHDEVQSYATAPSDARRPGEDPILAWRRLERDLDIILHRKGLQIGTRADRLAAGAIELRLRNGENDLFQAMIFDRVVAYSGGDEASLYVQVYREAYSGYLETIQTLTELCWQMGMTDPSSVQRYLLANFRQNSYS